MSDDEQELWQQRAKRTVEHALFHMDEHDVRGELDLACTLLEIANGVITADSACLDNLNVYPGDKEWECEYMTAFATGRRPCGYTA